jgi:hypothetical protein
MWEAFVPANTCRISAIWERENISWRLHSDREKGAGGGRGQALLLAGALPDGQYFSRRVAAFLRNFTRHSNPT